MYFGMRRSTFISFTLHAAIILAAIIVLPTPNIPEEADSDAVSMQFIGPSIHSDVRGKTPAATKTLVHNDAQKAPPTKLNKPIVAPPPPPPAPPPTQQSTPTKQAPASLPPPPPPQPSETVAQTPPPPPKTKPKSTSTAVQPPIPLPPIPQPPAPSQSVTHQQHVVKTPVPLSKSVLNTLQDLKTLQQQDKPPTSTYNPASGGDPNAGGDPNSTSNAKLSAADRDAIGNHVRPCWDIDGGAENINQLSVLLQVTTDTTGTVRQAVVAPADQDKMTDGTFAAFANRAINAVMNVQCATLPLPPNMMGSIQTFTFHFSP
jgi:hypothetical protein